MSSAVAAPAAQGELTFGGGPGDVGRRRAADARRRVPLVPATVIRDAAALAALAAELRAAGRFGVAVLTEGGEATRTELVGIGFALPDGGRRYLPLGRR